MANIQFYHCVPSLKDTQRRVILPIIEELNDNLTIGMVINALFLLESFYKKDGEKNNKSNIIKYDNYHRALIISIILIIHPQEAEGFTTILREIIEGTTRKDYLKNMSPFTCAIGVINTSHKYTSEEENRINVQRTMDLQYKVCKAMFDNDIPLSKDDEKSFEILRNAINKYSSHITCTGKIRKKISQYLNNKACYATLHLNKGYNDIVYFTLSGNPDKEDDLLKSIANQLTNEILPNNYHYNQTPELNNQIRYYYDNEQHISFNDFVQKKTEYEDKIQKICDNMGVSISSSRMFSCCERKLITRIYSNDEKIGKENYIYVNKPACFMCERALSDLKDYEIQLRIDGINKKYMYNEGADKNKIIVISYDSNYLEWSNLDKCLPL